ncbi:hypothetical protein BN873_150270 [Candidatus Competibacter denitrificans Run_A_D11]|uniref:Uncharacterized protein n=1 Tax=Candidatus Competibacter denitrificans Run_A_D11 TaxID=1400863 RepID=W6M206_9GAMM|nr:hypothetical protein BN873_150270 [Candidatus Competibacter denitrificans Run_A_D11]
MPSSASASKHSPLRFTKIAGKRPWPCIMTRFEKLAPFNLSKHDLDPCGSSTAVTPTRLKAARDAGPAIKEEPSWITF